MNRFRQGFGLLLLLLLVLFALPMPVSANSPPPAPWYTFELQNPPEGTVYMDLLIWIAETDPHYSHLESENLPASFGESAQIVTYCQDGFRSYTFHYAGAKSRIRLNPDNKVTFFVDSTKVLSAEIESVAQQHKEDIENRGTVRLALLDAQGNILQVSDDHAITPTGLFSYSVGSFRYDARQDVLEMKTRSNVGIVLLFLLVGIGGMVATCVIEWFVALAFDGIKDYSSLTVATNIVSQLIMRIGQMLLHRLMFLFHEAIAYLAMVAVLEILVYTGELLFYSRMMKGVSRKRCLAYTVCANTASLLAGLILLLIFVF